MTPPRRSRHVRPKVFLHIGEPKTGTTFLQQLLWANCDTLAEHGVRVAGAGSQAVFRAVQDLRGIEKRADDPAAPWAGEWDELARDALHTPRVSVISHELLAAADEEQVAAAVESLRGGELHLVLSVRDLASLLPAEWQESVKHRSTRGWDDWLGDVIDKEAVVEDRREFWFWRVHDTAAILELWARYVPRAHIHVLTVPPEGADPTELWRRFADLLELDPAAADLGGARRNSSLGLAETELLRRLNGALSPSVPNWFYMWNVKEPLAHGVLAQRPTGERLRLPAERHDWARAHAEELIAAIRAGGYDVCGDLDDLRPPAHLPTGRHPGDVTDEELFEVAVAAAAAVLERRYRRGRGRDRGRFALGEAMLKVTQASPGLHRHLDELSERSRLVSRGRAALRHRTERAREPR